MTLPICSAEDLFVMKMFAGRGKDIDDAKGIAARQALDTAYIVRHLEFLLEAKGTPEMMAEALRILGARP